MRDPLLQRASDGDESARTDLVAAHAAGLRRYLDRRMGARLRRTISGADLAQEVFLRAFKALRSLPDDATLRTFRRCLFRHANWVLANHGSARQRLGESAVADPWQEVAAPSMTTGDVTRGDQVAWLRALLDRLPPKYADVVRLRITGLSFAAIGERLGLEEASVRQRFARVLAVLREQAEKNEP